MAKLTLDDLGNLENENTAVSTINDNNALIEAALEKTLSRDGTTPNSMSATLDMNTHRIINLPEAVDDTDPMRKGDVQELVDDAVDLLVATTPITVFDLAIYIEGVMLNAENLMRYYFTRSVTLPLNLAGSICKARVAATASTVLTFKKNGSSIGTATFASSGTTATFSVTATTFVSGDLFEIVGPGTADASLEDTSISIPMVF